ncbi:P18 [Perigonia lusca single nucleopolyhedrovirus]|uniref:p18 n=1 Tax=Perigonia lusca single nucleopolyhedrovirus TaxID=1675865 RepID=A0A0M3WR05_9ABAC|nr:P18 [Perigonia lusca single nucleopolyhedrovirus]AKN80585.1 P18 [Perigonia lusca single nucleopolyhedrovirus]
MAAVVENCICLYIGDMPPNVVNDKPYDEDVIYFESVVECLDDDNEDCDKFSFFATLKKEGSLFMKKTFHDLLENNNGNYCKNHVLIDALLMYKTYVELVDESAFGSDILKSCIDYITNLFKVFRLHSRIVIVLPSTASTYIDWQQDNLSALLKHLHQLSVIEIVEI